MATQIEPGQAVYIRNQIIADGVIAFASGERVVVEAIEPNPKAPQYKYVVCSTNLGKRFQLSDNDVCVSPTGEPEGTGGAQELLDELSEEQPRVEPSECLHKYYLAEDGKYICRKCGSVLVSKKAQGGEMTTHSEVASSKDQEASQSGERLPNSPSSCAGCGNTLSDSSIVCGVCGAPNVQLIERRANREERNLKGCYHDYRYTLDQNKICINCAKIVPLKTPVQRKKYAIALGDSLCFYCGASKVEGHNLCERCGRQYTEIEPLTKKEYDPRKVRLASSTAKVATDWVRRPRQALVNVATSREASTASPLPSTLSVEIQTEQRTSFLNQIGLIFQHDFWLVTISICGILLGLTVFMPWTSGESAYYYMGTGFSGGAISAVGKLTVLFALTIFVAGSLVFFARYRPAVKVCIAAALIELIVVIYCRIWISSESGDIGTGVGLYIAAFLSLAAAVISITALYSKALPERTESPNYRPITKQDAWLIVIPISGILLGFSIFAPWAVYGHGHYVTQSAFIFAPSGLPGGASYTIYGASYLIYAWKLTFLLALTMVMAGLFVLVTRSRAAAIASTAAAFIELIVISVCMIGFFSGNDYATAGGYGIYLAVFLSLAVAVTSIVSLYNGALTKPDIVPTETRGLE